MGYRQELSRAWSGFTNFAISFTIISVLAGTFTTFFQAWNSGGPIAVSIGWPVICFFVLMVAFSMAELTSRYPTAGGPYWWANELGGPGWSWMTGWFNIVGLLGIVASVGIRRRILPRLPCSPSTGSTSSASTSATTSTSSARRSCSS